MPFRGNFELDDNSGRLSVLLGGGALALILEGLLGRIGSVRHLLVPVQAYLQTLTTGPSGTERSRTRSKIVGRKQRIKDRKLKIRP